MKAIAKLLIVEGKTVETDTHIGGTDPYKKFFAVTRDIKVGGVVAVFNNQAVHIKTGFLTFLEDDTVIVGGEDFSPNEGEAFILFKVLGEISPKADWVKDGDEIEVEMPVPMKYLARRDKETALDRIKNGLKVKCPTCNTLH